MNATTNYTTNAIANVTIVGNNGSLSAGNEYSLTCNVEPDDTKLPETISWFKNDEELNNATDAVTILQPNATQSTLQFVPAREDDEGIVACKATFPNTTEYAEESTALNVNYLSSVTLSSLLQNLSFIKRYDDVYLYCNSIGKPTATISWFKDGSEIEAGSYKVGSLLLGNEYLVISSVSCTDNGNITCKASNTEGELTSNSLNIVTCDPKAHVTITGVEPTLVAGQQYTFTCTVTVNAMPTPNNVTWYKNNLEITNTTDTTIIQPNATVSLLQFIPRSDDNRDILACRAYFSKSTLSMIEDFSALNVLFLTDVTIQAALGTDLDNLSENQDVYFRCDDTSKPAASVTWYKNGERIRRAFGGSTLFTRKYLTIRQISCEDNGNYTCKATNPAGEATSNALELNLVCEGPKCASNQKWKYKIAMNETVDISCAVEAPNAYHLTFSWAFDSIVKGGSMGKIMGVYTRDTTTVISYSPQSPEGYGNLSCRASYKGAGQKVPCFYQILPVLLPSPVKNCSVLDLEPVNGEECSMMVNCIAGPDDGVSQSFNLEVRRKGENEVFFSYKNNIYPRFTVMGLQSGAEYNIDVTAQNKAGLSPRVQMNHITPSHSNTAVTLGIVFGVILGLAGLIGLVMLVYMFLRGRRKRQFPRFEMHKDEPDEDDDDAEKTDDFSTSLTVCASDLTT